MVSSAYIVILVGKKSVPVRYNKSLYITKICFGSVHCIKINHKWFLSKQATVDCYQGWQYGVFVFIAGWVVLFPFTLYIGVVKLRSKCLNPNEFLFTLLIPTSMILFLVRSCLRSNVNHGRQQHHRDDEILSPIDVDLTNDGDVILYEVPPINEGFENDIMEADRSALLALITEPFKIILEHPNTIPDDGDYTDEMNATPRKLVWEPVLLWRRLILLTVSIFIVDPILKLYPVGVLLVLFGFHDYMVKPFTDHMLNVLQTISYRLLIVLVLINFFWAFSNNLDLTSSDNPTFHTLGQFLLYFEVFILLFPAIVFIGLFLRRVFLKIYKYCLCKQD